MDYLKNHCWCSDSIWGGHYDCKIIVSLNNYEEHNKLDWSILFTKEKYFSEEMYKENLEFYKDELEDKNKVEELMGFCKIISTKNINTLNPLVFDWLMKYVPDDPKTGDKMWCIGSKEYVLRGDGSSYSFFFQRRKDAMKFIKAWSIYRKPVYYTQYFTDVRKKLNLETMKYEDR